MSITNEKGDIGEAAFVLASAKKGYWTGKMPQGCPYDYVLDRRDGKLERVQVKFRSMTENGTVVIKLKQNTFTNRTTYTDQNVDSFAVYVNELDTVFLIPIAKLLGVNDVILRCVESTKRKDKNSRIITEYAEW
jgi:hypothetical protein